MAAVEQISLTIQFIKNPSETVQLAAVQQYGYADIEAFENTLYISNLEKSMVLPSTLTGVPVLNRLSLKPKLIKFSLKLLRKECRFLWRIFLHSCRSCLLSRDFCNHKKHASLFPKRYLE